MIETKESQSIEKFVAKLHQKIDDIDGLLENIGVVLDETTKDRMETEKSPDLEKWPDLTSWYKQTKKGNKILQEDGYSGGLIHSLNTSIDGDELTYGTNKVYAAIHQFGGIIKPKKAKALAVGKGRNAVARKQVTIPQREFLGFGELESKAIQDEIDDILKDL
mgnify:CR=1 FL=1